MTSQKQNKGTNKNENRFTENKQVVVRGKKGGRMGEIDAENYEA